MTRHGAHFTAALILTLASLPHASAQRGDKKGQAMPEVWRDMDVPAAPALTPEQALASFSVDPEFELQLVAAEPLVEDPVAITWDEDGRLWVVEMRGYMPNVDGTGEEERNGRVVILEDRNGDGRMDHQTVFLDQLQMPRAVAVVKGGALVAEPPVLWFCQDTDGDGTCDNKTAVADYARQGPVEHTDNGLMRAIDNRLYNAKSSKVFQWDGQTLQETSSTGRGQWGIAQDDLGRLFYNSNSSYLHADLLPAEYFYRNPNASTRIGIGSSIVSDQSVWSVRVNPGINRGYQGSMLKGDGRLARTTAVSGVTIYRGDRYPEAYRGNAFVPEPSGNVVSRFVLTESGYSLKAQKQLVPDSKWEKREFLASTDERFRPVSAATGPDGCLYIVDLYRGILQHKVYVTSFLRAQILERGLDKPVGLGRIYRLVHKGTAPAPLHPNLSKMAPIEWVKLLAHPNGWMRDTAQRLLVDRADPAMVAPLRQVASRHPSALARMHALWTLHGMKALDGTTWMAAMKHADPHVRITGYRVSDDLLTDPLQREGFLEGLSAVLREEPDPVVNLYAAFALGSASDLHAGRALLIHQLARDPRDSTLRAAILSGLRDQEAIFLAELLQQPEIKDLSSIVSEISTAVFRSRKPAAIEQLLAVLGSAPEYQDAGLGGALKAKEKRYEPVALTVRPAALDRIAKGPGKKHLDALEDMITWKGAATRAPAKVAVGRALTGEETARLKMGAELYQTTCMPCHQPHGQGQPGVAPSLVDSPWILGSPDRLIRIALHGLQGPVTVQDEEWNLVMPPLKDHPQMTDEGLAAVLTYVRRAWDHTADPVDPRLVSSIRKSEEDRIEMWTVSELQKLK